MRSNHIGLHSSMKIVKKIKKKAQEDLDWMMHDSKKMCFVP